MIVLCFLPVLSGLTQRSTDDDVYKFTHFLEDGDLHIEVFSPL